tara:strand:- start:8335 stop:10479 length:2145 start_codon:yes stop_codon:yes gene_type:complete
MQVELNSVWVFEDVGEIQDGTYRVLSHYPDDSIIVIFRLTDDSNLQRPIAVSVAIFIEAIENGQVSPFDYLAPFYQLVAEETISEAHKNKRNFRFHQIKDLIRDPNFLVEVSLNPRCKIVARHAKKQNTYVQGLYRSLNLFWKYGQELNALLPAYKNSGGAGQPRIAGDVKRGSPIQVSTPGLIVPKGVNTSEEDKVKFLKAMKCYGLRGKAATHSRVYDQMLKEFYADELISADIEQREVCVPSYRAFIYWVNRLIPKQEIIRKQTSLGYFDRNLRGLSGSSTDHTEVPGSCFELDATVLDVHVVSEIRRNHVLGRPTLYLIIDKESRMIVGMHVSMEFASWRAGRQALVNCASSKKEYCAQFGIEIEDKDWPCNHIPQRLLCDRGEFICKNAEDLAVPLIGHLSIAPPYRADRKGTIEQRFNMLNKRLNHELQGTTLGRPNTRGDRDPRADAIFTLKEVTTLLVDEVLSLNRQYLDSLAGQSRLFIESGNKPCPLNYWNFHLDKHLHALNKVNEAEVRSRLLPVETVSMTSKGIRLNDDMYYECDRPEFEDWKTIARSGSRWSMEARIDQDNSSFIYVRLQKMEGFTRCALMLQSSSLEGLHRADVLFFEDWKKLDKKRAKPDAKSVEQHQRRKAIVKRARGEAKNAPALSSKVERTRGMKERRREAIEDARLSSSSVKVERKKEETNYVEQWSEERNQKVVSLLKRKKDHD